MSLDFYKRFLQVSSLNELVSKFQESLIPTNRTPEFFVDWPKIRENVNKVRIELALWSSLIGSKNVEEDFKRLVKEYPEALKAFPILLAIRELEFPVISDFFGSEESVKKYNFNRNRGESLSRIEVESYFDFARTSGVLDLFRQVKQIFDYVLGIEVGMDTNARKNRSGYAMERIMRPVIDSMSKSIGFESIFQKKFGAVKELWGTVPPRSLINRESDFILFKSGKLANIEVNYYSGAGSKPEEIVDSYINRKRELGISGWKFIWITDGDVWRTSTNQLQKAFMNIDYVLNLNFVRKGLLASALRDIFT
jgi:type II restriction enzyme